LAHNGPALGGQAGEGKLTDLIKSVGFNHIRLAAKTLYNLIIEAKP
jgi:hypothetical protein